MQRPDQSSPRPDHEHGTTIDACWRPIPRLPAYKLVVERVQERIDAGALGVGDRLPPERELATLLDISRPAVREGLRILEALGGLRMGVGTGPDSGTIVTDRRPVEAVAQLLRLHRGLSNFSLSEIAGLGIMLETWSAQQAALAASDVDQNRARRLLREMRASQTSQEAIIDCDAALHAGLAEVGGNRLVADMVLAVRGVVRDDILAAYDTSGDWPSIFASLNAEHDDILSAIHAGDAVLAADRAERHARTFFSWLKSS